MFGSSMPALHPVLRAHFGDKEQTALARMAQRKLQMVFMLCLQRRMSGGGVVALSATKRRRKEEDKGIVVFFLRLGQTHSIKRAIASYLIVC